MKDNLAITKNVQRFLHGIEMVKTPIRGRIGNMLAFGVEGTGKSEVAQWYANQNDIPYVRAKKGGTQRGLLATIIGELGEAPVFRTEDLFEQLVEFLFDQPTPIIVDEVDYLLKGSIVETLRDVNDVTNTPIIMVGMGQVDRQLKRLPHLYDRFSSIVKFELFDENEVASLAQDICEVPLSDCAVRLIATDGKGKLRLTTAWFAKAEKLAHHSKLTEVTARDLRSFQGKMQ